MSEREASRDRPDRCRRGWRSPVAVAVLIAALMVVSACSSAAGRTAGSTTAAGSSVGTAAAKQFLVIEINAGLSYPYAAAIHQGIQTAANQEGNVKLVVLDSKSSSQTEAANVQDAIAQHPSLVILQPNDAGSSMKEVDALKAAGIPTLAVHTQVGTGPNGSDRPLSDVYPGLFAYVTQDEVYVGQTAGRIALQALPSGGTTAIIEGSGCCFAAVHQREQGFLSAVRGKNFVVVAKQPGAWTSQGGETACQNILTAHPNLQLIYAQSDDMANGCEKAVAASHSTAKIVGVGGEKQTIAYIQQGLVYGTVCQRPNTLGQRAMQVGYDQLTGKTHYDRKYISLQTPAATKQTLSDCTPQW